MQSLYEQSAENWDKLAQSGRPNLREMAKHFYHPSEMDRELGLNNCAHHWNNGRNGATKGNDLLAKHWLEHNAKDAKSSVENQLVETVAKFEETRMLLIVATPDQAAKIEKIVALIGAEVTDV